MNVVPGLRDGDAISGTFPDVRTLSHVCVPAIIKALQVHSDRLSINDINLHVH